ncbi:MAG: hypothetical protein JWO38_496 [Gemmataceae bacterium]|nr:hypothetical protein [Gemmataceae bacterium]
MLSHPVRLPLVLVLLAGSRAVAADPPPASVAVSPAAIEIRHHRHPHAIQVLGATADGFSLDLRAETRFTAADPKVATVDERGWVRPVGTGETQVTVAVAGQTKTVAVKVQLPAPEPPTSFRHEVMPVLTKAGCNAGACHGYSLGKNGFKLSLRGETPELDYFAIVKDSAGRRANFQAPAASLLIAKARGESAHEGGARFARGSLSDDILNRWIGQGAPDDLKDPVRVVAVRLVPDKLVLRPGQKHRLQLIAEYDNGTRRDVTRLGIFTANNDLYAVADDEGLVTGGAAGETAVVGRFERLFAATGVTVLADAGSFTPAPVPADNLVDKPVVEKLNRLKIVPSPVAGDEEFLRRVYLDLIGVQPKPDEVKAFLADKDPKKRETLVDVLFARPEFVDHWSLKWGDLLQNTRTSASSPAVFQFREFIRGAVAANTPMDEFARKILTARGGISEDPAAVYYTISKDTNDTVERVTQVFCGVRMLCARCHSHPMENWTQADYYGLASFFSQVTARQDPRLPAVPNTKIVSLSPAAGFAVNPRTGRAQPPRFLGGKEPAVAPGADRRETYAAWLTAPENPFFARGLVNRVWSYFFHRGIIDPVDDIRSTNPPINPALLDALTADFVAHKFDVRQLMRRIVTSATYQRSSVPNASNRADEQNFSRAIPRRVPAEALLDSLVQATGVPESFGGAPGGFRAAQLPDANVTSDFLRLFGKPQRMDACECERDNGSNMLQALHFINGKSILGRVQNPGARPALLLAKKPTDDQLVTDLYLWSLARHPGDKELKLGIEFVKSYGDQKTAAAQDLMWALLNSKDFLLVH